MIQPVKRPGLPTILLIIGLLVAAASVALTFETESRWIGHAVTSTVGLSLMIAVVLLGAVQKGRIKAIRHPQTFRYHRMAGIWFSLFVIVTFILGLLTTLEHGEPFFESLHGQIGLVLAVLALVQLVPSLLIRRRTRLRLFHAIVGYSIVPTFLLQMFLGLVAAGVVPPIPT